MGRVVIKRAEPAEAAERTSDLPGPLLPAGLDLVAVLLFVLIGRLSHEESLTPSGLGSTAWPFLPGLVGGYVGLVLTRWPPTSLRGGGLVAGKTIVLGLVIRTGIAGDGVPLPFVIVTVVVLTGLMLGWRFALARTRGTQDA